MTPEETEAARAKRRREFIEKHRHELAGLVLDGATFNRTGGELALWCRNIMYRTDAKLALFFDELIPAPKPDMSKATEPEKKLADQVGNKQPPPRK